MPASATPSRTTTSKRGSGASANFWGEAGSHRTRDRRGRRHNERPARGRRRNHHRPLADGLRGIVPTSVECDLSRGHRPDCGGSRYALRRGRSHRLGTRRTPGGGEPRRRSPGSAHHVPLEPGVTENDVWSPDDRRLTPTAIGVSPELIALVVAVGVVTGVLSALFGVG